MLLATAHEPPFLQGLPLQPSNTLSQRWPGGGRGKCHHLHLKCARSSSARERTQRISTRVSRAAFAAVAVGELHAVVGASGVAGVRQALVDVALAALAHVARRAQALVAADAVHALAVVEALGLVGQRVGGGGAVVQVDLTVDAC